MFNLLDNANKYAPAGTPIEIALSSASGDSRADRERQGHGIPQQDLERVFDKFYRGDEGDGRRAGTGLGLAICRGIVKAMGGTISAESPVANGRGTRIHDRAAGRHSPMQDALES